MSCILFSSCWDAPRKLNSCNLVMMKRSLATTNSFVVVLRLPVCNFKISGEKRKRKIMSNFRVLTNFMNRYSSLILQNSVSPELSFVRHAAHKVARHTRQKAKPPGVKRLDGDYVRKGEKLVVQFNLHFHPGLNVEIENDNTLLAMRDGQVMMTCERINPKKDSYIAQKYYANMAAPAVYKRYFHVIPFQQGQKFKLVDLV